MNIQQMMKQAQAMQTKMAEMQKEAENIEVEGKAGGGMVTVVSTCNGKVKKVSIDPSIMDDKEMVEDLVVAAFNNAKDNADTRMSEEMKKVASSMGLPPNMLKMPF